jgi:hypothetical protein
LRIGSSRTTPADAGSVCQGYRLDGYLLQIPHGRRQVPERRDILRTSRPPRQQVHGHILRSRLEPVERVSQRLPGVPRQKDLVRTYPPIGRKPPRLIGTLTVGSPAVPRTPARPRRNRELGTAPFASIRQDMFRHCDVRLLVETHTVDDLRSDVERETETSEATTLRLHRAECDRADLAG